MPTASSGSVEGNEDGPSPAQEAAAPDQGRKLRGSGMRRNGSSIPAERNGATSERAETRSSQACQGQDKQTSSQAAEEPRPQGEGGPPTQARQPRDSRDELLEKLAGEVERLKRAGKRARRRDRRAKRHRTTPREAPLGTRLAARGYRGEGSGSGPEDSDPSNSSDSGSNSGDDHYSDSSAASRDRSLGRSSGRCSKRDKLGAKRKFRELAAEVDSGVPMFKRLNVATRLAKTLLLKAYFLRKKWQGKSSIMRASPWKKQGFALTFSSLCRPKMGKTCYCPAFFLTCRKTADALKLVACFLPVLK